MPIKLSLHYASLFAMLNSKIYKKEVCIMPHLLIIEDIEDVNDMLRHFFQQQGYTVHAHFNGIDGLKAFEEYPIDLVILDIMLPYITGDEILNQMCAKTEDVPILMLSAKDEVRTKIDFLKLGADDYLTKPFDLGELAARVETLLRRYKKLTTTSTYSHDGILLDDKTKTVTIQGELLNLTATEYGLLLCFLQQPNQLFTKATLYEKVWETPYFAEDDIVKAHISNLRKKLKDSTGKAYIETIRGLGYRLEQQC